MSRCSAVFSFHPLNSIIKSFSCFYPIGEQNMLFCFVLFFCKSRDVCYYLFFMLHLVPYFALKLIKSMFFLSIK